ncbi:MAG: LamG domain-containing protein [Planctomycetota bacterium]|jgi:hypothetical protein
MESKNSTVLLGVICLFIFSGGAFGDVPDANLVAHWAFDTNSGTSAVDSAGTSDGTLMNGTDWIAGVFGSALEFYGFDQYVSIPPIAGYSACEVATICAWIKLDSLTGGRQTIFSNFQTGTSGTFSFYVEGDSIGLDVSEVNDFNEPSVFTEIDRWYHVAVVFEYSDWGAYLYVNGVNVSFLPFGSGEVFDLTYPSAIGSQLDGSSPTNCFDGAIDDVRIYSDSLYDIKALCDEDHDQVLDIYDNCISTFNPDQTDMDGDGIGDMCDDDTDDDGVPDADDNCPESPNPGQEDADGDGIGDICDQTITVDDDGPATYCCYAGGVCGEP